MLAAPRASTQHMAAREPQLQHTTVASPPPSLANWKLWSCSLRKVFSSSNMSKLMQLLSSWTEHYNCEYLWQWHICPTTYHLYHQHDHIWMVYKPSTLHCTSNTYCNDPEPTNSTQIPQTPVTPEHLPHDVQISFPIPSIQRPMQPTGTPNPTLIQHLTKPCQPWAHSLWHKIHPHDSLYQLHETLGQGQTIFPVSDASINH